MALRGENVGTAYIRIIADGDGLDRSIRDEFKKAEPSVREAGREHADAYAEEYNKELRKSYKGNFDKTQKDMLKDLNKGLTEQLAKQELADRYFKSRGWTQFKSRLESEYGDAGALAGQRMEQRFRDSANIPDMSKINWGPEVRKAQEDLLAEVERGNRERLSAMQTEAKAEDRLFEEHLRKQSQDYDRAYELHIKDLERNAQDTHESLLKQSEDYDRQWQLHLDGLRRYYDEAYRMNTEFDRKTEAERRHMTMLGKAYDANRTFDLNKTKKDYSELSALVGRFLKGEEDFWKGDKNDLLRHVSDMSKRMEQFGLKVGTAADHLVDMDRNLRHYHGTLSNFGNKIDAVGEKIKKFFGNENVVSRVLGSLLSGVVRIASIPTRGIEKVLNYVSDLRKKFDDAGRGMRGFAAVAGSVLGDVGSLFGAVAAGFGGLFTLLGPLVSGVEMLGGSIIALAGTIGFGLAGAAVAASAVLLPLAGAFGAVTFAIMGMTTAQKAALKVKLSPLINEFHDLQRATRAGLFGKGFEKVHQLAKDLKPAITGLEPLFHRLGGAVADVGAKWAKGLGGDTFTKFRDSMEKFLPGAIRKLGDAASKAFGGIAGILRAMVPQMDDFLRWLDKTATRFDNWANSTRGQNSLATFFDHAAQSASVLGGFIVSLADLFGTLLGAGRQAGDSLFTSLTNTIDSWNRSLQQNPKGLQNFFANSAKFARALGRAIEALGSALGALNTKMSREIITGVFSGLAYVLHQVKNVLDLVAPIFNSLPGGLRRVAIEAGAAVTIFGKLGGAIGVLGGAGGLGGLIGQLAKSETRMQGLKSAARLAGGVGGMLLLSDGLNRVHKAAKPANSALGAMETTLGGAGLGASLGSIFGPAGTLGGGVLGAIAGGFIGVKKGIEGINKATEIAKPHLASLGTTFDNITGKATAATRALIYQKLQLNGTADAARHLGINGRDLVSAVMNPTGAAANRVNKALTNTPTLLQAMSNASIRSDLSKLNAQFDTAATNARKNADNARTAAQATETWAHALKGLKDKKLKVAVESVGMDPTLKQWQALNHEFDLTPKQVKIIAHATGLDLTMKQAQRLSADLKNLNSQHPTPKARLDAQELLNGIKNAQGKINNLGGQKPTPKANLNTDSLFHALDKAGNGLQHLANQKPTPTANLNDNPFAQVLGNVTNRLNAYGQKHVSATVDVQDNASSKIQGILGNLANITSHVFTGTIDMVTHTTKKAAGGLTTGPEFALIGEAGPEAVVPLDRPLSQVDPAVRWLSAIAQGKDMPRYANGGVAGSGKTINVGGMTIVTPNSDSRAVASEVVNRLVAVGYS